MSLWNVFPFIFVSLNLFYQYLIVFSVQVSHPLGKFISKYFMIFETL